MKTVFYITVIGYTLVVLATLWLLWYDRERALRDLRKAFRGAGHLLREAMAPIRDRKAKKAERGLEASSAGPRPTAEALARLGRTLARTGLQLGWLAADPPRWGWPRFSPSPQRPWDREVDGDH